MPLASPGGGVSSVSKVTASEEGPSPQQERSKEASCLRGQLARGEPWGEGEGAALAAAACDWPLSLCAGAPVPPPAPLGAMWGPLSFPGADKPL